MSLLPSKTPLSEGEQIVLLTTNLAWAEMRIRSLEERLRQEMIRKYGPKSETLSDAQLMLLEFEPGVSSAEVEAESKREPMPPSSPVTAKKRESRKHPGRQEFPAHLPRVEQLISCTPEQCSCKVCGKDTVVFGYEQSEQLDVAPAQYVVATPLPERVGAISMANFGSFMSKYLPPNLPKIKPSSSKSFAPCGRTRCSSPPSTRATSSWARRP